MDDHPPPTPEQIQQRAAEIQAGWTDGERTSRWRERSKFVYDTTGVEEAARGALAERLHTERFGGQ